jgi:hypothetical protein
MQGRDWDEARGALLVPPDRKGPYRGPGKVRLQAERKVRKKEKEARLLETTMNLLAFVAKNPGISIYATRKQLGLGSNGERMRSILDKVTNQEGWIRRGAKTGGSYPTSRGRFLYITPTGQEVLTHYQEQKPPI